MSPGPSPLPTFEGMDEDGARHSRPAVATASIQTLLAARELTDPALHPEREDSARWVSSRLDELIDAARSRELGP